MQVFIPYQNILETAKTLFQDKRRFNKAIIECKQILRAIKGETKAWVNHPVTKMYKYHSDWLTCYLLTFEEYKKFKESVGAHNAMSAYSKALSYSIMGKNKQPNFLTDDFCTQHKRRLFTKNPNTFSQFAKYGISEENWYVVNNELIKYVNGKKI